MSKQNLAIMIPFNPHLRFHGGSSIGSLIAHKWFADEYGAVFWDLLRCSPHNNVNSAFFYDVKEKAVTHKGKVEYIRYKHDINKKDEKYIPNWRKINWEQSQDPTQVWIKLYDIFRLKRYHKLSDFYKRDNTTLKRVQNFAIVQDKNYKVIVENITINNIIDDKIYGLLIQKDKLIERDIEDVLWYFLVNKNLTFVDRQQGKDNRLDIAFENKKGDLIIVEIKKGVADVDTIDQIKKYMMDVQLKLNKKVKLGIILCRKAELNLKEVIKEENDIVLDEFHFNIEFPVINRHIQ